MPTLTWQDVAGQVRAPDFSDASAMITEGIQGLGSSVRALGEAPEQRRQADLAKQMMVAQIQKQATVEQMGMAAKLGEQLKTRRKEGDVEEYGSVASSLEAGARDWIAQGKGDLNSYLAQSEIYAGLDAGARAVGGRGLSEAAYQGDSRRIAQEQEATRNRQWELVQARQASQFARQEARADRAEARENRESNARISALGKAEREARLASGELSNDPLLNAQIRNRRLTLQAQAASLVRGKEMYSGMGPAEAAKKGGLYEPTMFSRATSEVQNVVKNMKEKGLDVDDWMVNQLLAEGGGAESAWLSPNGIKDREAERYLTLLVNKQDAYISNLKNQTLVEANILDRGYKYSEGEIDLLYPIQQPVPQQSRAAPKRKPY